MGTARAVSASPRGEPASAQPRAQPDAPQPRARRSGAPARGSPTAAASVAFCTAPPRRLLVPPAAHATGLRQRTGSNSLCVGRVLAPLTGQQEHCKQGSALRARERAFAANAYAATCCATASTSAGSVGSSYVHVSEGQTPLAQERRSHPQQRGRQPVHAGHRRRPQQRDDSTAEEGAVLWCGRSAAADSLAGRGAEAVQRLPLAPAPALLVARRACFPLLWPRVVMQLVVQPLRLPRTARGGARRGAAVAHARGCPSARGENTGRASVRSSRLRLYAVGSAPGSAEDDDAWRRVQQEKARTQLPPRGVRCAQWSSLRARSVDGCVSGARNVGATHRRRNRVCEGTVCSAVCRPDGS